VHPAKKQCIYARAYPRLKHYGEENSLLDHEVPPLDYDLWQTASWLNFFMGRDHSSRRLGIVPPEKKKK
jgi:methylenetetrahydrofolate reductase (NADPH)